MFENEPWYESERVMVFVILGAALLVLCLEKLQPL